MGYLNKETVTVDAILTKCGRELLAQGNGAFNITKFAVADDEIDYSLYDTAHPLGTQYYGAAIENMPIVEASPNAVQNLRSKLLTPEGSNINALPVVALKGGGTRTVNGEFNMSLDATATSFKFSVDTKVGSTVKYDIGSTAGGYTAELYDGSIATIAGTDNAYASTVLSGVQVAISYDGEFTITRKVGSPLTTTQTVILITGNESGATCTVNLTVQPKSIS